LKRAAAAGAPPTASAAALGAVFTRWEEIAGPALARHAWPLRLSGGVLVVAVDHPAWATQVRALGTSLLARVGEVSGEVPDRLQVSVRPRPAAPGTHPEGGGVG
jgi:predicted nucleic acid-binding Zn ribbon protein